MSKFTIPELSPDKDLDAKSQQLVGSFVTGVRRYPAVAAAMLRQHHTLAEVEAEAKKAKGEKPRSDQAEFSILVGALLSQEIDLQTTPDPDTAAAMRKELTKQGISPRSEDGRIQRLVVFAMRTEAAGPAIPEQRGAPAPHSSRV